MADIHIAGQPPLDGISLLPLIEDHVQARPQPMGFWDYQIASIRTPSAEWMGELLAAQQNGGDLEPYEASRRAAELPSPAYPLDKFPGHAAWIDGDWKPHRLENKQANVTWELYNLANDPAESTDLSASEPQRVKSMKSALESWLASVVRSLNGEDYPKAKH